MKRVTSDTLSLLFGTLATDCSGVCWPKLKEAYGSEFVDYFRAILDNRVGRDNFRRRFHLVLERLGRGLILDVGCGFGDMELMLSMHGNEIVGVDIDKRRTGVARRWLKLRSVTPPLIVADASCLPFKDASFMSILAVHFIHHIRETDRLPLMQEFARCVRPQGRIVIHEANGSSPILRIYRRMINMGSDHLLTPVAIRRICNFARMRYRLTYCFFVPPLNMASYLEKFLRKIELAFERFPWLRNLSGAFIAEVEKIGEAN